MEASIKTLNSEIKKLEAKRDRNNKRKAELEKENTEILSDLKELNAIKEQYEKFELKSGEYFKRKNSPAIKEEDSRVEMQQARTLVNHKVNILGDAPNTPKKGDFNYGRNHERFSNLYFRWMCWNHIDLSHCCRKTKMSGRVRTNVVVIHLSDSELNQLNKDVTVCKLSRENYLRMLMDGYHPKPAPSEELKDCLVQLRRIGNNMNQITYVANCTNDINTDMFKNCHDELSEQYNEIMKIITNVKEDNMDGNNQCMGCKR